MRSQPAVHGALGLACLYVALPMAWVLRTSFVPDALAYQPALLPGVTLENYARLFAGHGFGRAYANSLLAAAGSTALALPLAASTAYAFARYRTGGATTRLLVLATQMLPPVAIALPVFALFRGLGLTNSLGGLVIVYAALNLAFLTWILTGFFEAVPRELEWAALVDGAGPWGTFWRIALPLAAPGLAAAAVLGFVLAWNEFLFALVLTGPATATVPVALAGLQSQNGVQIAVVAAGVVLGTAPLLVAAGFVRRHLVGGLAFGALK